MVGTQLSQQEHTEKKDGNLFQQAKDDKMVNVSDLSSQVYGIAGTGISLGLLAGLSRNIVDMYQPRRRRPRYKAHTHQRPRYQPHPRYYYKPSRYQWRF